MKNPFLGLFRARDKPGRRPSPRDAVSAAPGFYYGASLSGKSVTPTSAIQVSAVYACVRVIAETVASLPLHVYEATDTGSRKANEHPLYRLLHDEPNTEMTSFVWRETMLSHLLLYGNSYCQIIRSGRSKIVGLYPLLPDRMTVDRDSKCKLTYTYTTSDGKIADEQLEMLLADMQQEYENGNYVVGGGDFNKDLLGNSGEIFGVSTEGYTWAQPIKTELFEGKNLTRVAPLD